MSECLCASHHNWLRLFTTKSLTIINKEVRECGYVSENIIVVRLKFQYFCLLTPARHALYRFVALTGYIVAWILLSSTWSMELQMIYSYLNPHVQEESKS